MSMRVAADFLKLAADQNPRPSSNAKKDADQEPLDVLVFRYLDAVVPSEFLKTGTLYDAIDGVWIRATLGKGNDHWLSVDRKAKKIVLVADENLREEVEDYYPSFCRIMTRQMKLMTSDVSLVFTQKSIS